MMYVYNVCVYNLKIDYSLFSRVKERRLAAFELASMAATSDDNKFLIVAENGLDTLISLSLTDDVSTQEYSAEALAELLTITSIQVGLDKAAFHLFIVEATPNSNILLLKRQLLIHDTHMKANF